MRFIALLASVFALAVAAPAIADKGGNSNGGNGNGNGNGGRGSDPAWVSASPNPAVSSGARVEVTGCGYDVNYPVELHIVHSAGYTDAYGVGVWSSGCMNPTPILTAEAGTYTLEVYQRASKETRLMATSPLVVG